MKNDISSARNQIDRIDKKIAKLFSKRLSATQKIAFYKKENSLPILDKSREAELLEENLKYISDNNKKYYIPFQKGVMNISKKYQFDLLTNDISLLCENSIYNVHIEKNSIKEVSKHFDLSKKVLILSDEGIPNDYIEIVKNQCENPFVYKVKQGEKSKSIDEYTKIISYLSKNSFTREDKILSIGGGVVGDLGGFCASTYMRGIDFYNIPTTLLSMADSSIGGKTAVNYGNIKNLVGTFYQPKSVLIDTALLKTLDKRIYAEGIAEIVKIALILDENLFERIESGIDETNIDTIIKSAISLKANVVENDEKETNLRQILNFGHTIGHGIEANSTLYHGECVSLGMMAMCSENVKARLCKILEKYDLPINIALNDDDIDKIIGSISHDKKKTKDLIKVIFVDEIGQYSKKEMSIDEIKNRLLTIKM